jgi:hypothetical protein
MARYLRKYAFAKKELDAILVEWSDKSEHLSLLSYNLAIRAFSSLNTKNEILAVSIGAAAYSILTGKWFNNEWHDKLTETCEEGYEAGFAVRDIIFEYLSPERIKEIYG